MTSSDELLTQYLRFATDINRNLSHMIHLTNNLRYNTFQVFNNYTNSTQLTNDIFFPPVLAPPPPLDPPPIGRRRVTRSRRYRASPPRRAPPPTRTWTSSRNIFTSSSPTQNEINQSTETLMYADISTNQTMCPIGQQNFEPTDQILRIRHCGHIFTEGTLRQWFRTSHECPVCRFDIRQRTTPTTTDLTSLIRSITTQTIPEQDASANILDPSNNSNNFAYSFTMGGGLLHKKTKALELL